MTEELQEPGQELGYHSPVYKAENSSPDPNEGTEVASPDYTAKTGAEARLLLENPYHSDDPEANPTEKVKEDKNLHIHICIYS